MKDLIIKLKEIETIVELNVGKELTEETATDIYGLTNELIGKVKKLPIYNVSNRYKVEWSHHMCHPETCCHNGDYRVYDTVNKCYIDYSDDEKMLKTKYGC